MGEGGGLAISHSMAAALAILITLAMSFTAYIYGQTDIQSMLQAARGEAERQKTAILERINLLYWHNGGDIWISNDGDVQVNIVKIYVDDRLVWQGNLVINPNEIKKISVGVRGRALAIETSSGNIVVLKR